MFDALNVVFVSLSVVD